MSKVQIVPDELGNVVRQSTNNPEFGYVRLEQERVSFGSNGWVKRSNLSTLLHGKMEDLNAMDLSSQIELKGKIIVREQTEPFSANDPDRDLKYAGNTGIVCCSFGEPIYRKTFFVTDVPDRNPRGMHSHFETKQLIICLKGSIDVRLHDGKKEKIYKIKQGEAIYIPNLIWDEQIYNSIETILVSLCSTHYNTEDYIHDFEQFKNLKNENNKT